MEVTNGLVLIVDDEVDLREVMAEFLASAGYETLLAADGNEALVLYREYQSRISLVLSDVNMIGLDGISLMKACLAEFGHIPIVLISTCLDFATVSEALRLGVIDYVEKPYDPNLLLKQIPVWKEIGKRKALSLRPDRSAKMDGLLKLRATQIRKI